MLNKKYELESWCFYRRFTLELKESLMNIPRGGFWVMSSEHSPSGWSDKLSCRARFTTLVLLPVAEPRAKHANKTTRILIAEVWALGGQRADWKSRPRSIGSSSSANCKEDESLSWVRVLMLDGLDHGRPRAYIGQPPPLTCRESQDPNYTGAGPRDSCAGSTRFAIAIYYGELGSTWFSKTPPAWSRRLSAEFIGPWGNTRSLIVVLDVSSFELICKQGVPGWKTRRDETIQDERMATELEPEMWPWSGRLSTWLKTLNYKLFFILYMFLFSEVLILYLHN